MDDAARAELDALRLRAYGPTADIADDPAALERLIELEERARPAVAVESPGSPDSPGSPGSPRPPDSPDGPAIASPLDGARATDATTPTGPPRRARWHSALVAAVAVIAVPLGIAAAGQSAGTSGSPADALPDSARAALSFVSDPDSEVVITIRIDASQSGYIELPSGMGVPSFPADGEMTWVEPLGDYFGWELWIGGARGAAEDQNCLLLVGQSEGEGSGDAAGDGAGASGVTRANCVSTDVKAEGALVVSMPFAEVPAADRPEGMTAEQSLGFLWDTDGTVKVLVAPTPTT